MSDFLPHRLLSKWSPEGRARGTHPGKLFFQASLGIFLVQLSLGACSSSGGADAGRETGGSEATGGRRGSGGAGSIDPDALAKNCAGLSVADGASCSKVDLVCKDPGGSLCLCENDGGGLGWNCVAIGNPGGTGGASSGGSAGDGNLGGDAGAPSSSGGAELGGDSSAGSTN
jgi:hypothetical protein